MPFAFGLCGAMWSLAALALAACGSGGGGPPATGGGLAIGELEASGAAFDTPFLASCAALGGAGTVRTWRLVGGLLPPGVGVEAEDACFAWEAFSRSGTVANDEGGTLLTEVSGIANSRQQPGIQWVHDDGGQPAYLFALDPGGEVRQRYALATTNIDWEDLCLGPGPDPTHEYIYIGDVGDNGGNRAYGRILRVVEPLVPLARQETIDLPFESFAYRFPDGARDVEALLLDAPTQTLYVVEKGDEGGDVYRFPGPLDATWTEENPVELVAVTANRAMPASITAGDATRDGRRVALRGYFFTAYEYVRPPGGSFADMFNTTPCPIPIVGLPQYEALAYDANGLGLATTTELSVLSAAPIFSSSARWTGASCLLSGTPTARGTFAFTLEVEDESGATALRMFEVTVN